LPFIVVWTASVDKDDATGVTTRGGDNKRYGLHTEQIMGAEEDTLTSGEVYVIAYTPTYTLNIFEQTLDSLRELDKAETVILERVATALERLALK
jgi:hypothetical protein